ncbi:hypothetical protein CC78DRAFT_235961 [Lojkania enalia]|uniref:Zn(2)-C6 fungal-type domain-containing protein n=1 Tax=Lojkania enalia TaxID=147567 RepID=A0A9P4TQQ4_9PLEO|nr:hypothetical protein CC78DRAFT_235961 [Didymosphaeria enalia]
MTTPDAEDASPSPDYSGDLDGSDMAVDQQDDKQTSDASPTQTASNGQRSSSNSKDPLRPRRKKARRACFACQRAHLTCGDERPCHRCIKRGLQDSCMDGVRKKAKYLHDAPDAALMPGVGGNFPSINGTSLPGPDSGAVSAYFSHPPSATFYGQNSSQVQTPATVQDGPTFNPQPPISPPYSQTNQNSMPSVPSTVSQGTQSQMHHFGEPLFDPSNPALFNFDISNLNFGNHYGALELHMLNHMSSGAADTPPSENTLMNPLNQAASIYNPQMSSGPYTEGSTINADASFVQNGLPNHEWAHSRHGSLQISTPHNTPTNATVDYAGHRNDSLNGPHAYAIGQGPSSLSSASPSSTDLHSGYDNENPLSSAAFFANKQHGSQHSPTVSRLHHEHRQANTAPLQPIQSNAVRKRRVNTKDIYEGITKPYDYVGAFHRLQAVIRKRMSSAAAKKIILSIAKFRPVLLTLAGEMDYADLLHQEMNLQRVVLNYEEKIFPETGTPSLLCRRTGEIVGLNKEFTHVTGWERGVLLGHEPNMNVNTGPPRSSPDSGLSTRTNSTPTMVGQESDTGPRPVFIIELMDESSAVQWWEELSELAFTNSRGYGLKRVNMLKYRTKKDMERLEEMKSQPLSNGNLLKQEPAIKLENKAHQEAGIGQLGAKDGLVDCMIVWNIKRDNLDVPFLACIQILPVLDQSRA